MNTNDLEIFKITFESDSFSEASKRLYMSPQGVAKIISRLENELNVELFHRTKQGITPTAYGIKLYHKNHELSSLINDILTIKDNDQEEYINIDIYSTYGVLQELGFDFFNTFQLSNPKIHFNIVEYPDIALDYMYNVYKANIGFMNSPIDSSKYNSYYLETNKFKLVIHKDSELAKNDKIYIHDLENHPFAIKGKDYKIFDLNMDKFLKNSIYPNIVLQSSLDSFLIDFVIKNKGVSIMLESSINYMLAQKSRFRELVLVKDIEDIDFIRDIYFVEKKQSTLSREEIKFRDYVLDLFKRKNANSNNDMHTPK